MADRMTPPGMTKAMDKPAAARMPPPGMTDKPADEGGKVPTEQATIVRSDEHCIDCKNYSPDSGECAKIDGYFDPADACVKYFEALGDSDEQGEPDADDMPGGGGSDAQDGQQ